MASIVGTGIAKNSGAPFTARLATTALPVTSRQATPQGFASGRISTPRAPTTTGSVNAPTGVTVAGGPRAPSSIFDLAPSQQPSQPRREGIKMATKKVSAHVGSTLATPTAAQNPLGTSMLPRPIAALLESVSPKLAATAESTYAKLKFDSLLHLPGQILGGIRSLVTLVDAALTLPLILLADIYNGLLEVMELLNEIIDSILNAIFNFFFGPGGLLDDIIPGVLGFIQEVSALAGEIGALAGMFVGANPVTNFTNLVQNYTGQLGSFLQNPVNSLLAYAPPQVTQALYTLRNPQQLLNSVIPPQVNQMFSQLANATGMGMSGGGGYGFGATLNGLRGGVLSSILSNYSGQYPILGALLGPMGSAGGSAGGNSILFTTPVNPNLKTSAGGFVQPQQIPEPVISSTQQLAYNLASSNASTQFLGRTTNVTQDASGRVTNFSIKSGLNLNSNRTSLSPNVGRGGGMLRVDRPTQ